MPTDCTIEENFDLIRSMCLMHAEEQLIRLYDDSGHSMCRKDTTLPKLRTQIGRK
jgi:hypothetical protein